MTSFRKLSSAAVALSMAAAPVAAQAQSSAAAAPVASSSWGGALLSYVSSLCAQQAGGCILPLPNAAPPTPPPAPAPAPVVQAPPPAPAPAPEASGGFNFLPILLGLASVAGGILLLDGDGDDEPIST